MMKEKVSNIDIIIPWVDGNDPEWRKIRTETAKAYPPETGSESEIRFQSWDNLHLWFRAVETRMPWFHKIILVTAGHLPRWLNTNHPRLSIVRHDDYIPEKYLPTFNSNTIEMNYHRIECLSEDFIIFNDDMFPVMPIADEYYFKDGMVCDEAVENIITTAAFGPVGNMARYVQVNNMFIINKYFNKRNVQAKNREKWFCSEYGERLERTKSLVYWRDFPGFYDPHLPSAMKKSTLKKIWELEGGKLDISSNNHFRAHSDLSQYLVRYWQLCDGNFNHRKTLGKVYFADANNCCEIAGEIRDKRQQMVCINENCSGEEFETVKETINNALIEIFPEKSSFER